MVRRVLVVAALFWLLSVRVLAQEPGQRIRVKVDTARTRWITGTLVTMDSEALVLNVSPVSPSFTVPRHAVRQLQVSRGVGRSRGSGALIGFGVGLLTGFAIGWHADSNVPCNPYGLAGNLCSLPGDRAKKGLLIGAAGGALVGALIGHFVRTERWGRVDTDR